ncbi:zinc finger MYM-type protein 1-like [Diabrotica undecimpunctata]|uniref:zinc finger MYM-type protein 1-like n=1 Tax=Diabrotica undecimpunctata TaxID=50387 RepID=UPI003B631C32
MHKHADSGEHLKNQLMFRNFEQNQNTIADALKENARLLKLNFNENIRLNRICLRTVIDAVLYLSKQELSFRGHDEKSDSSNRGNFKELLNLLIVQSPLETKNHYEKIKNVFSGESKTIQNELIECISGYINDNIISEIKNSPFFSLQIDDTTDITQMSQTSIILRCVNSLGLLIERFMGFYDVSAGRTAEHLFTMAATVLEPLEYRHKLVGQCYDGASVMSGHLNGLQQKIKSHAPQAIFVHCLTHRLNLVLQQSFKKISKCRIFFATITGIPSFFHSSAKRSYALASTSARRMSTITETRWSSNSKLFTVIIEDWEKLKEVFDNIMNSEESDGKSVQLAKGFLRDLNDFEFTFLAIVFSDIFHITDILYDVLQKKSLDINFCLNQIRRTRQLISDKRNEEFFNSIFEKASTMTVINTSKRFRCDDGMSKNAITTQYRALCFEIYDHILMEMDIRFQDYDKLKFISLADTTKFESYSLTFPFDAFQNLFEFYGTQFTKDQRLKSELCLLYADENYKNVNLQELVIKLQPIKDIVAEAYNLFCLILTIPSTSVSVERSFSCLKRLKTFTRNTISQDRLSSLTVIALHKELLNERMQKHPFYEDIIDRFASLKDRRIDLVYKN